MADPSIRDLADKVDDLSRLVARQSGTLGQLADARRRPGLDLSLLVDLHGLRADALAAADATRSGRERTAFESIATGLERLLAGRGGKLVVPRSGHPFSAATMEAAEEVPCAEPSLDRTVAVLLEPGLEADGRTVRPARVAVHRYSAQALEQAGGEEPASDPEVAASTRRSDDVEDEPSGTPAGQPVEEPAEEPAAKAAGTPADRPDDTTTEGGGARKTPVKQKTPARRAARASGRKPPRKGQSTSAMTPSETRN